MTTDRPTRRTRRHEQGERSREDILDAASILMSTKGFSGTSISELAAASGLPASSIYWHFESKSGVLAAVMERGATRFFAEVRELSVELGPEPRANLLELMRQSTATVAEHPEFLRLFMLLLLGSEGGDAQVEVVRRVRTGGRNGLGTALRLSYSPWGDSLAEQIEAELVDVLFALFDGVFIAGQTDVPHHQDGLVVQLVDAVHALALDVRQGR